MPRRKDQDARRSALEGAAERALARHGAEGFRVADVASEAGLSAAAVLYYYPTRVELMRVAFRRALERFVTERRTAIEGVEGPRARLVAMVELGFPEGSDDEEVVNLYTGVQATRSWPRSSVT
jgi:AcrR family transcriptional regulator